MHACPYFPCSCQHFPAWNDKVVNFQAMKVLVATMMIPSEHLMSLLAKDLGWSNCEIDAGSYMGPLPWTFWEHDGKHIPTALSVTPHGTQHILLDWQGFALCYVLSQKAAVVATYTYSKTSMREGIFSWKPPYVHFQSSDIHTYTAVLKVRSVYVTTQGSPHIPAQLFWLIPSPRIDGSKDSDLANKMRSKLSTSISP